MLEKTLVDLEGDWKLYRDGKIHPKEDGIYRTIRAGYSRIYEMVNRWKMVSRRLRWIIYNILGNNKIKFR